MEAQIRHRDLREASGDTLLSESLICGFSSDRIVSLMIALAEDAIGLSREVAQSLLRIYKTGVSAGAR